MLIICTSKKPKKILKDELKFKSKCKSKYTNKNFNFKLFIKFKNSKKF